MTIGGDSDTSSQGDPSEPLALDEPAAPAAVMGYEGLDPLPERLDTWESFLRPSAVWSYGHLAPLTDSNGSVTHGRRSVRLWSQRPS